MKMVRATRKFLSRVKVSSQYDRDLLHDMEWSLNIEPAHTLVALVSNKVVGAITYARWAEEKRLNLQHILVSDAHRHKGYGRAMVERIHRKGCELRLYDPRRSAIPFYKKIGFRYVPNGHYVLKPTK